MRAACLACLSRCYRRDSDKIELKPGSEMQILNRLVPISTPLTESSVGSVCCVPCCGLGGDGNWTDSYLQSRHQHPNLPTTHFLLLQFLLQVARQNSQSQQTRRREPTFLSSPTPVCVCQPSSTDSSARCQRLNSPPPLFRLCCRLTAADGTVATG